MSLVEDGSGSGFNAKVNANNRLYISGIAETRQEAATEIGDSYHVLTGMVTLTSANQSAMMYFKNESDVDFRIKDVIGGGGIATGATMEDVFIMELIRNPSTGTIVDDETAATIRCNRNFGSSKLIQDTALVYKGAEAKTFTNGTSHFLVIARTAGHFTQLVDEVIPKGKSLGILITPPSGNTSFPCYVGIIGHYEDPKE